MTVINLALWALGHLFDWLWPRPGEGPEAERRARLEAEILRANERLASLDHAPQTKDPKEEAAR